MYETKLFENGKALLEWAQKNIARAARVADMVGWDGQIRYFPMTNDLGCIFQLEESEDGWNVCEMHMVFLGDFHARADICRISKFYRPDGEFLWHALLSYGGRQPMDFCVVNALQKEKFEKYSQGGNFEMVFSGLGDCLECRNDKGVLRTYRGALVEQARVEKGDPTIDHADLGLSELRVIESVESEEEPALAEFSGVVESCKTVTICGVKCYRMNLMSGPLDDAMTFPWTLLIAARRVAKGYVPRVGDSVHGAAYMFGSFYGDAQARATIYLDEGLQQTAEATRKRVVDKSEFQETVHEALVSTEEARLRGESRAWELLPRWPEDYPEVESFGGGLAKSVAERLPKFVVYSEYRKRIRGYLTPLKEPSRKELNRILDSIDFVIPSAGDLHVFGSVMGAIGIRHFVVDEATGERHLWCALPSRYEVASVLHTNLLIALNAHGEVLRYTFYAGPHRLPRGIDRQITFQSKEDFRRYGSMDEVVEAVDGMTKDDFLIVTGLGPSTMLQAYCDGDADGVRQFTIDWQIHYLPWHFTLRKGTQDQLVAMLKEFERNGIESVETMAQWEWCRMKGNT